jgi:hypothetical protein
MCAGGDGDAGAFFSFSEALKQASVDRTPAWRSQRAITEVSTPAWSKDMAQV